MSAPRLALVVEVFRATWSVDRSGMPPMAAVDTRRLALRQLLDVLRREEPNSAALGVLEAIEQDLTDQFEILAREFRRQALRAECDEAVRQVEVTAADGGPSELTIAEWMSDA